MKKLIFILFLTLIIDYSYSQVVQTSGVSMDYSCSFVNTTYHKYPQAERTECHYDQYKVTAYLTNNSGKNIYVRWANLDFGDLRLCDNSWKNRKIEIVGNAGNLASGSVLKVVAYIWVPLDSGRPDDPGYSWNWEFE